MQAVGEGGTSEDWLMGNFVRDYILSKERT
jgi:hypothetical protein